MTEPVELDVAFAPFAAKMSAAGLAPAAVAAFRHAYAQVLAGATGMIGEDEIDPVVGLPDLDTLDVAPAGADLLDRTVVVKLNGGLGTSMGMTKAKSLLEVKDGRTFLDIIVEQVLHLRAETGARLPLVLMDSFRTREDALAVLAKVDGLAQDVPFDFVQHKVPKVRRDTLAPVEWPADPELEWCPPGHGDLYPAMITSGMLDALLAGGYEWAFVSNADNLGAVLDRRILAHVAATGAPFLMEVADRTDADRKGGHLARRRADGRLVLRESAQCPDADAAAFADIDRYRYFNTNTLWVHLPSLQAALDAGGGVIALPLIRNAKTVDPSDASSPAVYQLETAMGAAIGTFDGAAALRVPRTRFAPVKTTDDLVVLRSDAYVRNVDGQVVANPACGGRVPFVSLDPAHYKLVGDLEAHFPDGVPSLVAATRFVVRGDVTFGADIVVAGDVRLDAPTPQTIPSGTRLS